MMLPAQGPFDTVPGKAQAAQNYLHYAHGVRTPPPLFDGARAEPGELSPKEQLCYDAALDVLIDYFQGRLTLDDGAPRTDAQQPPDDRVPVSA
jgi:hypothetical protein